MEIRIVKHKLELHDELYEAAVENVLGEYGILKEDKKIPSSKSDFLNSEGTILGEVRKVYEIKNLGKIIYETPISTDLDIYHAIVRFNELKEGNSLFNEIKSKLEKIINAKSIKEISGFLPDYFE